MGNAPDLIPAPPMLTTDEQLHHRVAALERELAATTAQMQAVEKWCQELAARMMALEHVQPTVIVRHSEPNE